MKLTDNLRDAYETRIASWTSEDEWAKRRRAEGRRIITRLQRRGIETISELIRELPNLPLKTAEWVIFNVMTETKKAAPTLWRLLEQWKLRATAAWALGLLRVPSFQRRIVRLAQGELRKSAPDTSLLDAAFQVLRYADFEEAADVMLEMFERRDLPGRLRGDVADGVPTVLQVDDRRSRNFRRALSAAIAGLDEDDICMQFDSMYVLASLAARYGTQTNGNSNAPFHRALPRLREIAANDSRLSPGFWWPMSAEAEDAIVSIETGRWPQPEAAERWDAHGPRGEWPSW